MDPLFMEMNASHGDEDQSWRCRLVMEMKASYGDKGQYRLICQRNLVCVQFYKLIDVPLGPTYEHLSPATKELHAIVINIGAKHYLSRLWDLRLLHNLVSRQNLMVTKITFQLFAYSLISNYESIDYSLTLKGR